jgi:radical SAM protein with 4Fe4S-binding SPASM domain
VGYFGPYEAALRHFGERGAHWGGCPAGKWSLGLEADGKIKACPSLPSEEYTGGMIGQRPIADVVYNAPELTFIKNRTREDLWGYCRECYYADVCKAGCTWTSQVFFGKPGNNPYCVHRSIEMEKRGVRETLVQIERAPGRPFDQGRFDIVEEPLDARPVSFSGFPLEHITAVDWKSGGVWTDEQLAAALAPKLAGPTRTSRLHIIT